VEDHIRAGADPDRVRPVAGPAAVIPVSWEWGAASLALGAVLAILPVLGLKLTRDLEVTQFSDFSRSEQRLAAAGGYSSGVLGILLTVVAIAFAVAGIGAARREGRPIALGLAGLLLGGLDLFLWLGALLAWAFATWNRL
jgi:hypothetical protein